MRRTLALVAVSMLLLTACGGDEGQPQGTGSGGQSEEPQAATVEVSSSGLGRVLVDANGMTLYMFVPDQQKNGKPTCYGDCAQAWPAFEADGELTAGDGVEQSLLGTVKRKDGATQVTYNNLPLYHFSGDQAAGDTEGQGLNDVWWVLSPEGKPVRGATGGAGNVGGGGY
jgi:predicted lipoprotein with Yx(FWY)xxD motif